MGEVLTAPPPPPAAPGRYLEVRAGVTLGSSDSKSSAPFLCTRAASLRHTGAWTQKAQRTSGAQGGGGEEPALD